MISLILLILTGFFALFCGAVVAQSYIHYKYYGKTFLDWSAFTWIIVIYILLVVVIGRFV